MITDDELNEIEARANAATEGPWEAGSHWDLNRFDVVSAAGPTWEPIYSDERSEENAEFIAAARADVPRLVAEVRRLREAARQHGIDLDD